VGEVFFEELRTGVAMRLWTFSAFNGSIYPAGRDLYYGI
jgi:hypothetical protein